LVDRVLGAQQDAGSAPFTSGDTYSALNEVMYQSSGRPFGFAAPEQAGLAAARSRVPSAAAFRTCQQVLGGRAVVDPELVLRSVAAQGARDLHALPRIVVPAVDDILDADRPSGERQCARDQRRRDQARPLVLFMVLSPSCRTAPTVRDSAL
jgi:hypothetical protein